MTEGVRVRGRRNSHRTAAKRRASPSRGQLKARGDLNKAKARAPSHAPRICGFNCRPLRRVASNHKMGLIPLPGASPLLCGCRNTQLLNWRFEHREEIFFWWELPCGDLSKEHMEWKGEAPPSKWVARIRHHRVGLKWLRLS